MTNLHEASDVSASLSESDLSIRRFRGSTYDEALAAAESELGEHIRVIGADRIRRGGLGGFFATDLGVEVAVVPAAADAAAPSPVSGSAASLGPVSDADWDELMRRVEADDRRTSGPLERRVGVEQLLDDAERADRELLSWAPDDDLDVPAFLQNPSPRTMSRPDDNDLFGIDISPGDDDIDRIELLGLVDIAPAESSVAPSPAQQRQRIIDGGDGGRRLLDDVLDVTEEPSLAPADEPTLPPAPAHEAVAPVPAFAPTKLAAPVCATPVAADPVADVFADIIDYEPADAAPAAPAPVAVIPPPPLTNDTARPTAAVPLASPTIPAPPSSPTLSPQRDVDVASEVAVDPLRRPTELATIAAGRLAMRLAELPPFGGGLNAEAYRVSVAVTTPDGTRIEMSTEVDGNGD
jgi:hypothetical protein